MSTFRPRDLFSEGRYGVALMLIMSACIFIMAAPEGDWARVVIVALEGGALVASTKAADAGSRVQSASAVLVGVALTGAILLAVLGNNSEVAYMNGASTTLVLIATPVITMGIIRQAKMAGQVTVHTMLGVICIYLLMTLAFASLYGLIGEISGDPIFAQGADYGALRDYLYFSITTMTTLGIGDLTPADDVVRSLTAAESLIGQIYLVTVVAVIVGNLGRRR